VTRPDQGWLTETLSALAPHETTSHWPSTDSLKARARRRRNQRRTAVGLGAAVVVAVGVLVALSGGPEQPSAPNANLAVVGHSGSAVELAATTTATTHHAGHAAESQIAMAEEGFALSLLRQLNLGGSDSSNVVTSPTSLAAVLAMLELGARGSTASQIASVLGTSGMTSSEQADAWQALSADELHAAHAKGIDLESANSLWAQTGLPLLPVFMSELKSDFATGVWQVDFQQNPAQAAAALNSWVEGATHGRIDQLFDPADITSQTALILANAVYFKGAWQQPFTLGETRPRTFYAATGAQEMVPFMFSDTLVAPATIGPDYDAIQLPYKGGRFAALAVMPTTGTLTDLVDNMTATSLDQLVAGLRRGNVNLSMPRFQLTDSHQLNDALRSLGMTNAFDDADLSGISSAPLFVSAVKQKAFLKVTEQGTEAAAATGGILNESLRGARGFSLNHPFLLLIRDNTTGAVLFSAEVENPVSS
jgi:serpin B